MCTLCDAGTPQDHSAPRRKFLKASAATGFAVGGLSLLTPRPASADNEQGQGQGEGARGQRRTRPALPDPRRRGDVDGPEGRRLRAGRRAGRRQEDRRRRAQPARRRRRRHRCARAHRHAGLHRHAPSPVRDGAAQLSRRRRADQRRLGVAQRQPDLLRVHPAEVRARVPAAGRVHQRAVRRPEPARRRRDDGARRLADPSLAAALGRRDPGAVRHRTARRLRLLRERRRQHPRHQSRQQVPERRAPHQAAVVLVERPARPHDHGRRGLSRRSDDRTSRGRSDASSACRSRRTSCRRSASGRSSTSWPPAPAAPATSASARTTCSST